MFDHSAPDLVIGHIDVTENLIAGTGFLFAPAIIALADTCAAIGCGNNIPERVVVHDDRIEVQLPLERAGR